MRWYYSRNKIENQPVGTKVKGMLLSMVKEPINMVLIVALSMLALGFSFSSLPEFFQMSATRLSLMMTPLVLLFIGISVKLNWQQFRTIISLLLLRSSIAFLVSGLLLMILPVPNLGIALLIVIFPQSACSFWPFAHMSAVGGMEEISERTDKPTFDLDFAMNVLACSLPFSTVLILSICTAGEFFSAPLNVLTMTLVFGGLATLPLLLSVFRKDPQMVNH